MPFMLGIDALQLQIGEDFRKFHIEPSMGMSFPKIVANRRLTDEVQMLFSGMLPLMRMTIKISSDMFSLGKRFQQIGSVPQTSDRTNATIGSHIVVPENKGGLVRALVEFLSDPAQLSLSKNPLFFESRRNRFAWGSSITSA